MRRDPYAVLVTPAVGDPVLETLYCSWLQSRADAPVVTPVALQRHLLNDPSYEEHPELYLDPPEPDQSFRDYFEQTLELILSMDVPLLESISFNFVIEDMPIALREQLVRHREGAYWIQSGRIHDRRAFATDGAYYIPPAFEGQPQLLALYHDAHDHIQTYFNLLLDAGARVEDARNMLPASQLHRGMCTFTYRALKKMIGKRTSFIAQNSLWGPVLRSLSTQIAAIDPMLVRLFEPPTLKNGKYIGDPHELENRRRLFGTDPLPPDPIFLKYEAARLYNVGDTETAITTGLRLHRGPDAIEELVRYAAPYVPLWGEACFRQHAFLGAMIVDHWQQEGAP